MIPTTLLTTNGRNVIKKFCRREDIKYLDPKILKIKDYINSASHKFHVPENGEYNILFINWSFRDFPADGFIEPYAILTNSVNGLLNYKNLAIELGIEEEAFSKITAIICYTESIESLMFGNLGYVWKKSKCGERFFMWILDENIRAAEKNNESNVIFNITGMKPSNPNETRFMISQKRDSKKNELYWDKIRTEIFDLIERNRLISD